MRTHRYSLKGYSIDYCANAIYLNFKFAKKAQDYGSPEYQLLQNLKADFPMMKVIIKSGRKVDKAVYNKRLSYKNIEEHIKAYGNSELLERFELAIQLSKPLASPYKYVCDWFNAQFPDYRDTVTSIEKVYGEVELVDLPDLNNYEKKSYIA